MLNFLQLFDGNANAHAKASGLVKKRVKWVKRAAENGRRFTQ